MDTAPGPTELRILFAEDDEADAELSLISLRKAGYAPRADVVTAPEPFQARLETNSYDVVLADYNLPGWTGMDALEQVQRSGKDIPFILVTGKLGEETAVECIKRGAADCVSKDRLVLLPVAVCRAMEEKALQQQASRFQEALRVSERRYRRLFERNLAGVYRVSLDGRVLDCNDACARILGHASRQALLGAGVRTDSYISAAERKTLLARILSEGVLTNYEVCLCRPDGSRVWVLENAYLLEEEGGPPVLEGTMVDITENKRAAEERAEARACEEAARAQALGEAGFRELLEAAPDPILEVDSADCIVLLNAAAEKLFGYSRTELVGTPITRLMPEDSRKTYGQLRAALAGCAAPRREKPRELAIRRKNGRELSLEINLNPLRPGQADVVTCVFRDLTERKHLEEQLRQSQKMESIGRLAGGVAHDFNNLLTIIGGYSQMLLEGIEPRHPMRRDLEAVREAANRASGLTRQLLAFSRRQIVQPKIVDLNRLIGKMHKMLRRVIGEDIQLKLTPKRQLPRLKADPGQIEQVIMNLAVNARDAMPQGGGLLIETSETELQRGEDDRIETAAGAALPADSDLEPGRYVVLSIQDTGVGMDREVLGHIFEPFFTTKGHGQGTGLGLSTVYGIVKQSGGEIVVESEVGRGTTFRIYWPAVRVEAEPAQQVIVEGVQVAGSETILLVEDEPELRVLARQMLSRQGYRVLEADGGSGALRLWAQHGDDIDLLVTDVVMPQMSGGTLAEELRACRHDLKVLFISGYTGDVVARHGIVEADVAFLQKPFTPETLALRVRKLLDDGR